MALWANPEEDEEGVALDRPSSRVELGKGRGIPWTETRNEWQQTTTLTIISESKCIAYKYSTKCPMKGTEEEEEEEEKNALRR